MSQRFAIDRLLTNEHFAEFRELLLDRRIGTPEAMSWLTQRGYRICRNSVLNWRKRNQEQSLFRLRPIIGVGNDADTRQCLAIWAQRLSGDRLTQMATYAAYLINIELDARRTTPESIPGLASIDAPGDRKKGQSKAE